MSKAWEKVFCFLILLSILSNYSFVSLAQDSVSGAAKGRVYEYGNRSLGIAGAKVTARHVDRGLERPAEADANGVYVFSDLPPGIYRITAARDGYGIAPEPELSVIRAFEIILGDTHTVDLPPIALQKLGTAQPTTQPTPQPTTQPTPSTSAPAVPAVRDVTPEQLVNTASASRGGNFGARELLTLPLPGVRTFDDLAFLLPGVSSPPLVIGSTTGPGIGPGVGTAGQFSVNGIRSRSNNFTIDGSDNNDQDIGVRRQGFTSLVPQSIESVENFRVTTLLAEPQFARNMGAQVDAVSRSGSNNFHGIVYGFFTDSKFNARDPFNTLAKKDPFTRAQYGLVLGGPVVKDNTQFFASFEHQNIDARRESHFAVPTLDQRGLFGQGTKGVSTVGSGQNPPRAIFPSSELGNAIFSLFPLPNNCGGPYGCNTFTEVLPADGKGSIFSIRLDHNFDAFGKSHSLTGRYNFTDDDTTLPVTGEALFSSLRAFVQTQNFAVILHSSVSSKATNTIRFSYGRTESDFAEVRDPLLLPAGRGLTNERERRFLLNAPLVRNQTQGTIGGNNAFQPATKPNFVATGLETESITGPLGQVIVSGFSPIGVDVFNFPQGRTNHTFQFADTLFHNMGNHRLIAGMDLRRIHLDSFLDRNFRPLAVFSAAADIGNQILQQTSGGFYQGTDFVAAGAPTGFFQTLAVTPDTASLPDSSINLRYWETAFFLSDQIRFKSNFTLTVGARYELNTVPTDKDSRIEKTFTSGEVQSFISEEKRLNNGVSGLDLFLDGRTEIFRRDNNNVAPYVAFAWDPFGNGKTSIRGGYGIYYDQIPGAVISQSRNVFPTFIPVDVAGSTNLAGITGSLGFIKQDPQNQNSFIAPGTLNTFKGDPVSFLVKVATSTSNAGGPSFVLPAPDLVTPYTQHWGLTVEHQIKKDFLVSAAYVGTRGAHLLRFDTPNLGLNSIPKVTGVVATNNTPSFQGINVPPSLNETIGGPFRRPFPFLGSFTSIKSDGNSIYHSLQLQANKRFSHGIQFTTAYTFSHTIDDASDIFDLAGARALPQESRNRRGDRADANFDVRHRFVYSVIWELPVFKENNFLGGWMLSSIGTFQTGQPYTVLFCCDYNLNGNLTDRPGLAIPGQATGRNTFRAPGLANTDLAVIKNFRFKERQKLEFRSEFFNLFNNTHLGIPVHQLFFAGVAARPLDPNALDFTNTTLPKRIIQFALKYSF